MEKQQRDRYKDTCIGKIERRENQKDNQRPAEKDSQLGKRGVFLLILVYKSAFAFLDFFPPVFNAFLLLVPVWMNIEI